MVEREQRLRGNHRMAEEIVQYQMADSQLFGGREHSRRAGHRVKHRLVRVVNPGLGEHEVVARIKCGKAHALRGLGEGNQF